MCIHLYMLNQRWIKGVEMWIFYNYFSWRMWEPEGGVCPRSVYGPVDDISVLSLLPLAGNRSWPGFQWPSWLLIGQSWLAGCCQLLSDCMRRRQHLQEESTSKVREKPLRTLPSQNSKRLCPHQYFVDAKILSTPRFCRRWEFVECRDFVAACI
jgi:hypothetical protein